MRALAEGAPDPGDRHQRHPGGALWPEEALGAHWRARSASPTPARSTSAAAPPRLLDALEIGAALSGGRRPAGLGGRERSPGQLRGARLRHPVGRWGGGVPGGGFGRFRAPGPLGRAPGGRSTTCGAWVPSPRPATASRSCSTPTAASTTEALAALERVTERSKPPTTPPWRRVSPTPRPCAAWARPACRAERLSGDELRRGDRQPGRGVGRRGAGDGPRVWPPPATTVLALAYGGGEAIAQDIEVTAPVPVPASGHRGAGSRRGDFGEHVLPLDARPSGRAPLGGGRGMRVGVLGIGKTPTRSSTASPCATWPWSPAAPRWRTRASSPRTSSRSMSATWAR